jgi:hypothetical protein
VIPVLSLNVAIGIPLVIFLLSQKRGEVTIRGIQQFQLIERRQDLPGEIEVSYEGQKISSLTRYVLEIANTGNTDIDGSDVYDDLRWLPPTFSKILNAEVIEKTPGHGDFINLDDYRDELRINLLALDRDVSARISILCFSDSPQVDNNTSKVKGTIRGATIVDNSRSFNVTLQQSFFEIVFAGGFLTNVAKLLIFTIISGAIALLIGYTITRIQWTKRRKAK